MIHKRYPEDLAILGGPQLFDEIMHVGRPNIGDRERLLKRINDVLDRKWFTNRGPLVQEFERQLTEYLGVKHCIAMCNGTISLEIAIRALGMTGEVIIPANTFIATAHALQWQEITPVFCDINPSTNNIDQVKIEELITPRTSGIMGVHLWGHPCAVEEITEIACKNNLKLLFDAAHAFACTHNGKMIGNFGNAEIFSFHATKFINTFEGGAVVTNDDDLAKRIRLMKNFGFSGYDNVIYVGTNGKMSEISAAMGLTSLESLDEFIDVNYRNYKHYQSDLEEVPGLSIIRYDEKEKRNYQYIVVEVDEEVTRLTRDQIIQVLHAENILARRYFYPGCHRMEPYRSMFPHAGMLLPNTDMLLARVISFPTGTSIQIEDISKLCDLLRNTIEKGDEISERLNNMSNIQRLPEHVWL